MGGWNSDFFYGGRLVLSNFFFTNMKTAKKVFKKKCMVKYSQTPLKMSSYGCENNSLKSVDVSTIVEIKFICK